MTSKISVKEIIAAFYDCFFYYYPNNSVAIGNLTWRILYQLVPHISEEIKHQTYKGDNLKDKTNKKNKTNEVIYAKNIQ